MHGYYKFSSKSSVDEDSDVAVVELLEEDKIKSAERVILTEKANGKSCVMTMLRVQTHRTLHSLQPIMTKAGHQKAHFVSNVCPSFGHRSVASCTCLEAARAATRLSLSTAGRHLWLLRASLVSPLASSRPL